MKTSTRNTIISSVITGCVSLLVGLFGGTNYANNNNINNNTISLIVDGKEQSLSLNDYQRINEEKKLLSDTNEKLKTENADLAYESSYFKSKYTDLENTYNNLQNQFDGLENENKSLNGRILQLENELQILKNTTSTVDNIQNDTSNTSKRISIFDLDTFQGEAYWFNHSYTSDREQFIDTYGNEYLTGCYTYHGPSSKDKNDPTYLLDKKYSICEGQLAWPKIEKNVDGSIWIDFYSGDDLIYSTEPITATDKAMSFEFSIEGLETLTIVTNGTNPAYDGVSIIYPYFNLVQ